MDLTDRVPPKLLDFERWKDLFEAIDEYWAARVTPTNTRLKNLRSVFTAEEEDLQMMLDELTAYFDSASDDLSKPLSIFWKRAEIRNKNSVNAIDALLQRIKIATKDIEFEKLWAPKDLVTFPYGTAFYTEEMLLEMGADYNDYFLTSHMTLNINRLDVIVNDWGTADFRYIIERYFNENVRPLHIVFDGATFFIYSRDYLVHYGAATQTTNITISQHI